MLTEHQVITMRTLSTCDPVIKDAVQELQGKIIVYGLCEDCLDRPLRYLTYTDKHNVAVLKQCAKCWRYRESKGGPNETHRYSTSTMIAICNVCHELTEDTPNDDGSHSFIIPLCIAKCALFHSWITHENYRRKLNRLRNRARCQ